VIVFTAIVGNQDKSDGNFVCLSCVTVRCRFESGRDIKQAFRVVNPGQSIVTTIDGATVVGRAQADGMAMDVLMAVALVSENPGSGKNGTAMAAQQCRHGTAFSQDGGVMGSICHNNPPDP
tara:strand:+ start:546 stop:908 length:363 start_codon:yes stop_codon:yes gene_type:complete